MKLDLGKPVNLWASLGDPLWTALGVIHLDGVDHTFYNYNWAYLDRDLWLSTCGSLKGSLRTHMQKPL